MLGILSTILLKAFVKETKARYIYYFYTLKSTNFCLQTGIKCILKNNSKHNKLYNCKI